MTGCKNNKRRDEGICNRRSKKEMREMDSLTKTPTESPTKAPTESPTDAPSPSPTRCCKIELSIECVDDYYVDCHMIPRCSYDNPNCECSKNVTYTYTVKNDGPERTTIDDFFTIYRTTYGHNDHIDEKNYEHKDNVVPNPIPAHESGVFTEKRLINCCDTRSIEYTATGTAAGSTANQETCSDQAKYVFTID